MAVVEEDWNILLSLFPVEWEELGRKTGAIARLRGFSSIGSVLRTLLLHRHRMVSAGDSGTR